MTVEIPIHPAFLEKPSIGDGNSDVSSMKSSFDSNKTIDSSTKPSFDEDKVDVSSAKPSIGATDQTRTIFEAIVSNMNCNLACDLMEPFRPLVDLKVKKMAFPFFEKEEKHEMVSLLKEEVTIGNRNEYLTNAIKIYTRSVFDALNDNDVSQIKFYRTNEL